MWFGLSYSLLMQRCSSVGQYSCRTCTMSAGQGGVAAAAASVCAVGVGGAASAFVGCASVAGDAGTAGLAADASGRGVSARGGAPEQPTATKTKTDFATRSMQ